MPEAQSGPDHGALDWLAGLGVTALAHGPLLEPEGVTGADRVHAIARILFSDSVYGSGPGSGGQVQDVIAYDH